MEPEVKVFMLEPHELLAGLVETIREANEKIGYHEIKRKARIHLEEVIKETDTRRKLTTSEIHALASKLYTKVMMRSTLRGLAALSKYYLGAQKMDFDAVTVEPHKSRRLARHMKAIGMKRPINTAAHAIVSGQHNESRAAREILAAFQIRIDDPDNGIFLPRDYRFMPHPQMPKAVNHAKIHTDRYYVNITSMLLQSTTPQECRNTLKLIAQKLKDGTFEY